MFNGIKSAKKKIFSGLGYLFNPNKTSKLFYDILAKIVAKVIIILLFLFVFGTLISDLLTKVLPSKKKDINIALVNLDYNKFVKSVKNFNHRYYKIKFDNITTKDIEKLTTKYNFIIFQYVAGQELIDRYNIYYQLSSKDKLLPLTIKDMVYETSQKYISFCQIKSENGSETPMYLIGRSNLDSPVDDKLHLVLQEMLLGNLCS